MTDYADLVAGMKFSHSVSSDPYYRERMQEYIDAIETLVRERDEARAEVKRLNGLLLAPIRAALEGK